MPITTNAVMNGARGIFGKQVVFKKYGDRTIVAAPPDFSDRKLSPKQIHNTETMESANYYAQGIIANEQLRNEAQLRLNVQRNKLYTSLIREYYQLNYRKEEEGNVQKPAQPLNEPFVNYLLDNTDKTVEEIALLTNINPETIAEYKERRIK